MCIKKVVLLLLFVVPFGLSAQRPSDYTIQFKGRVKVNAREKDRKVIQVFFGTALGRKIESHKNFDRVFFDGDGFVAFVYHKNDDMVLQKDDFVKSMQVGLLIPSGQYETVKEIVKRYGVEAMLPNEERYKDHSKYYYFHAPGNQVFRIVNTSDMNIEKGGSSKFDAKKAMAFGADNYGMKKYVFAFLKRGPNRSLDKAQEENLQRAHLSNIDKMAEEGKLVLAGPFYGDGDLRGIYIFNVRSVEEAQNLTNTDPAIKAGSLQMELVEWYGTAALMEINDIHKTIESKKPPLKTEALIFKLDPKGH